MKNPHFEKPQAKNPHQLTVWQHILPNRSISRFTATDGTVHVNRFREQKLLRLQPNNQMFCAKRVWSQKAEDSSITIETAFQKVADSIINREINSLSDDLNFKVTEMYLLWRTRFLFAINPVPNQQINMMEQERELSKDEQERLEKAGILYVHKDGTVPSRALTGILLRRDMDIALHAGDHNFKWGVIESESGLEFLCPDATLNEPVIPVSPNFCLIAGMPDGTAKPSLVGNVNHTLLTEAHTYWFARDPEKCPVIKRTLVEYQNPGSPMMINYEPLNPHRT